MPLCAEVRGSSGLIELPVFSAHSNYSPVSYSTDKEWGNDFPACNGYFNFARRAANKLAFSKWGRIPLSAPPRPSSPALRLEEVGAMLPSAP